MKSLEIATCYWGFAIVSLNFTSEAETIPAPE